MIIYPIAKYEGRLPFMASRLTFLLTHRYTMVLTTGEVQGGLLNQTRDLLKVATSVTTRRPSCGLDGRRRLDNEPATGKSFGCSIPSDIHIDNWLHALAGQSLRG